MAAVSGPQADVLQPSLVFCQPAGIRDNARLNEGGISVNLDLEGFFLVMSLLFLRLSRIKRLQVMSMVKFGSTELKWVILSNWVTNYRTSESPSQQELDVCGCMIWSNVVV